MGQYWKVVNIDKGEFLNPHKLGCGLKLWEQANTHPGPVVGVMLLLTASPEARGGGDLDVGRLELEDVVGRWVGDRVMWLGDSRIRTTRPKPAAMPIFTIDGVPSGIPTTVSRNWSRVFLVTRTSPSWSPERSNTSAWASSPDPA